MVLRTGSMLEGYRLLRDFQGSANGRWTFAERGGVEYFIKAFQRPKFPPDHVSGSLRDDKIGRCATFEARHRRLAAVLGMIGDDGGVVAPVGFFRHDLTYYHVAPRIERAGLTPGDVAALPTPDRVGLLRGLSAALVALHSRHIVHGDLNSGNMVILRAPDGSIRPNLIDFDGAFFTGEPPEPHDLTFDQNYMAPEILTYGTARGMGGPLPGPAADIFSAAILMLEYWTGRRPTAAGGFQYPAEAVQAGAALRIEAADMSASLARLLRQCLARDPASRPDAAEIDGALRMMQRATDKPPPGWATFPQGIPPAAAITPLHAHETQAGAPTPPIRQRPVSPIVRRSANLAGRTDDA